jgi:protocatechuate 3,4-dioxygenase beta subunit
MAPWVPRHIHVAVVAQGFRPLMTDIYFPDDPVNHHDIRAKLSKGNFSSMRKYN